MKSNDDFCNCDGTCSCCGRKICRAHLSRVQYVIINQEESRMKYFQNLRSRRLATQTALRGPQGGARMRIVASAAGAAA